MNSSWSLERRRTDESCIARLHRVGHVLFPHTGSSTPNPYQATDDGATLCVDTSNADGNYLNLRLTRKENNFAHCLEALTWAIVDLCLHPEYITLLRNEISKAFASNNKDPYEKLYLMECFLRESSRLNPIDARESLFYLPPSPLFTSVNITAVNVQRKAMQPVNFSGGFHVPAGNLVAIPQREIMRDPKNYSNPEAFDPYRFMSRSDDEANTKYTDMNWEYTFWGSPRLSCPGRWYASYALKHALVHLLTTYEFTLAKPGLDVKRYFVWTTAIVPKNNISIHVKKQNVV